MGVEVLVPLGLFVMIFGVVATTLYFRFRSRKEVQDTVRALIASGQSLSTELLEELSQGLQSTGDDFRKAVISIGAGLGVVGFAFLVDEGDAIGPLLGIACFPFFIGLAYLFLWLRSRNDSAA